LDLINSHLQKYSFFLLLGQFLDLIPLSPYTTYSAIGNNNLLTKTTQVVYKCFFFLFLRCYFESTNCFGSASSAWLRGVYSKYELARLDIVRKQRRREQQNASGGERANERASNCRRRRAAPCLF